MTSPATSSVSSPRPPAAAEASTSLGTSPASGGSRSLPDWCPAWAERLGDSYLSGTSCVFLMHGNVRDLVPVAAPSVNGSAADPTAWGTVSDFLAREMFGRWDIVLAYDVGKGLRPLAGPDAARLRPMVQWLTERLGNAANWPRDPDQALRDFEVEMGMVTPETAGVKADDKELGTERAKQTQG